jgi:hypothetical protein
MVFCEGSDSGRRRNLAPADETAALINSLNALDVTAKPKKSAKSGDPEGDLFITLLEQQRDGQPRGDRAETGRRTRLIDHLTPQDMAGALLPLSEILASPANAATMKEHNKVDSEGRELAKAFTSKFRKQFHRDMNAEEIRDRERLRELLHDHPDLQKEWDQLQKYFLDHVPQRDARKRALADMSSEAQKTLNAVCQTMNLPPINFEFVKQGVDAYGPLGGAYVSGQAILRVPETLYDDKIFSAKYIRTMLAHELEHHKQGTLVMAKTIEDKANGNAFDDKLIKDIQDDWKARFGVDATEEFIRGVAKCRDGHKLTPEELKQVKIYERAFEDRKEANGKVDDVAILLKMRELTNDRSPWDSLRLMSQLEDNLDNVDIGPVADLLKTFRESKGDEAKRKNWDEENARDRLNVWTEVWIRFLQIQLRQAHDSSPAEQEAEKAGEAVGAVQLKP